MRIIRMLESVLDIVLPLRARSARTKARTLADIALSPASHQMLGTRITTLMEYREPAVQDLIRSLKYDGSRHAAALSAEIIADYLGEEIASARAFSARPIVLAPVPLHPRRMRERGWNQIELALRALPAEYRNGTHARLIPNALMRTRETRAQTRLPRSERLSNVAGAFAVAAEVDVSKTHVFLFDDVTTTGATLANAATPLRRAGAKVSLIALARA